MLNYFYNTYKKLKNEQTIKTSIEPEFLTIRKVMSWSRICWKHNSNCFELKAAELFSLNSNWVSLFSTMPLFPFIFFNINTFVMKKEFFANFGPSVPHSTASFHYKILGSQFVDFSRSPKNLEIWWSPNLLQVHIDRKVSKPKIIGCPGLLLGVRDCRLTTNDTILYSKILRNVWLFGGHLNAEQ